MERSPDSVRMLGDTPSPSYCIYAATQKSCDYHVQTPTYFLYGSDGTWLTRILLIVFQLTQQNGELLIGQLRCTTLTIVLCAVEKYNVLKVFVFHLSA